MNRSLYSINQSLNNGKSLYLLDEAAANNNAIKNNQSLASFANAVGGLGGVGNFTNVNVPEPLDINNLIVLNTAWFKLIPQPPNTGYVDIGGDIIFYNDGTTTVMAPNDGTFPTEKSLSHLLILTGDALDSVTLRNTFETPNYVRVDAGGTEISKLSNSIKVLGSSVPSDPQGIFMQGQNHVLLSDISSIGFPPEDHFTVASSTITANTYLDISKLGIFMYKDVGVSGDVDIIGNLGVSGDVGVLGNIGLTGDFNMYGNFGLTGGFVSITGDIGVTGDMCIIGEFCVEGTASILGNLGVTGYIGLLGNMGITGDLNMTGNLGVTGYIGLLGSMGVTGDVSISGNLGVTGYIGLLGNMGITGDLNMTGNFGLTGGEMVILGNFGVTGQAFINGNLDVSGNVGVTGDVGIGGTLSVGQIDVTTLNVDYIFPNNNTQISMVGDVGITGGFFGFTGTDFFAYATNNAYIWGDATSGILSLGNAGIGGNTAFVIAVDNVVIFANNEVRLQTNSGGGGTGIVIDAQNGDVHVLTSVGDVNIESANDLNISTTNDGFIYSGGQFGITGSNILSLTAPDVYINGINDVFIDAPLIGLTGYVAITGDIGMTGDIAMVGNIGVTGNVDVTGVLTVGTFNATNINVDNVFPYTGTLISITGDIGMTGDIAMVGNIGVTGNVDITGALTMGSFNATNIFVDNVFPYTGTMISITGDIGMTGYFGMTGSNFNVYTNNNCNIASENNIIFDTAFSFGNDVQIITGNDFRVQSNNDIYMSSANNTTILSGNTATFVANSMNISAVGGNMYLSTSGLGTDNIYLYSANNLGMTASAMDVNIGSLFNVSANDINMVTGSGSITQSTTNGSITVTANGGDLNLNSGPLNDVNINSGSQLVVNTLNDISMTTIGSDITLTAAAGRVNLDGINGVKVVANPSANYILPTTNPTRPYDAIRMTPLFSSPQTSEWGGTKPFAKYDYARLTSFSATISCLSSTETFVYVDETSSPSNYIYFGSVTSLNPFTWTCNQDSGWYEITVFVFLIPLTTPYTGTFLIFIRKNSSVVQSFRASEGANYVSYILDMSQSSLDTIQIGLRNNTTVNFIASNNIYISIKQIYYSFTAI